MADVTTTDKMRFSMFHSCEEAVSGMQELVKESGRSYETSSVSGLKEKKICREIIGYSGKLFRWDDRDRVKSILGDKNHRFLKVELAEWLNGDIKNPGRAWREDPDTWIPFLRDDGKFQYTYNQRLFLKDENGESKSDQIERVVDLLSEDPLSRQAFISIWSPDRDIDKVSKSGPEGRVPCTIGYHFLIRPWHDGRSHLEMVYIMRSLNVSWNLWNDLYLVTGLFEHVQARLRYKGLCEELAGPGVIHLQVGSLHTFEQEESDAGQNTTE